MKHRDGKPDARERRRRIERAMRRVEQVVGAHFPDLLDAVKLNVSVAAVGSLKDNRQPTTVILVAPASAGKSQALNFLMPTADRKDPLAEHFYRSDYFTPASFVSHRADVSKAKLGNIDLLPRLKGKTLLTKELAPFFGGKHEELLKTFSVLTAILDGQGYTSDSGAHGRRGYVDPINFQWLGATTPLSPEVLRVMAQLGPRMLFYDVDRQRRSVDDLAALTVHGTGQSGKDACAEAVRALLLAISDRYPAGSVDSGDIGFPDDLRRYLALWADVLTRLRASLRKEKGSLVMVAPEHSERVLGILRCIAIASALVHGVREVDDYDLAQVAHLTLSSGVAMRGRLLHALLRLYGKAKTAEVARQAGISVPTALRYMEELGAVGLADFTRGDGRRSASIRLRAPYDELCRAPLLKSKWGEGER